MKTWLAGLAAAAWLPAAALAENVRYESPRREVILPTAKVAQPAQKVFKSEAEFRRYFGTEPRGIDFTKSWAIFYTPGTATPRLRNKRYRANVVKVRTSAGTLHVTTRLDLPGACAVRRGRPFVLVTIPKQRGVTRSSFHQTEGTVRCPL